jgi:hypothetical protein
MISMLQAAKDPWAMPSCDLRGHKDQPKGFWLDLERCPRGRRILVGDEVTIALDVEFVKA